MRSVDRNSDRQLVEWKTRAKIAEDRVRELQIEVAELQAENTRLLSQVQDKKPRRTTTKRAA